MKRVYTAGLEAIIDTGAKVVCKHNRKRDVNFFVELDDYWVEFSGPVCLYQNGTCRRNIVGISVTRWHTDDLSEQGYEHFDNVKEAISFVRSAIRNPKRTLKKMETWFEE